jgi:AcrR family transcriptional regulator
VLKLPHGENTKLIEKPNVNVKLTAKEKILNACRKLFVKDRVNYQKISISDICEVAGVGRKTFYRYFNNKDEATFKLIENDVHGFELIVNGIISQDKSPVEKIGLLFDQFLLTYSEDFTADFIDAMRNVFAPEAWEYNSRKIAEVLKKFRQVIQDGIDNGSIRSDVKPELVLYMINSASYAMRNKTIDIDDSLKPDTIMADVRDIILNGIINHK